MKVLSLWQPWASLVALGLKTIETRSWSTTYRGPLLICAAARRPTTLDQSVLRHRFPNISSRPSVDPVGAQPRLPLGAVVAVCDLTDVVPIVDDRSPVTTVHVPSCVRVVRRVRGHEDRLWYFDGTDAASTNVDDQRPFGDFAPGRYAWLLANIRPLTTPVQAKGRQGLWAPDADLLSAVEAQR